MAHSEAGVIEKIALVLHDPKWEVPVGVKKLELSRAIAESLGLVQDRTTCATCEHEARFHGDDPPRCRLAGCPCEGFEASGR